uniref:Uncharacterized protein n=1 Tax=Physcomitrium patens TaxID=3218 RepID=A0A2K1KG30_PHYPA|nr:hypothetical protein PHYPA_009098 [Physcomitrium patens]
MVTMGFFQNFIDMINIILLSAKAFMNISNQITFSFLIQRRICQGCLVASNLFLLVGEVFNDKVQQAQWHGLIQGVRLLSAILQHLTFQYIDDTSFISNVEEFFVPNLINILDIFRMALELIINLSKFNTYWIEKSGPPFP